MECVPTDKEAVVKEALPELWRVPVPIVVDPSLNVTVPVGVPEVAVTVAVKVTDCPKADGFTDEVRAVVVVVCAEAMVTLGSEEAYWRTLKLSKATSNPLSHW